MSILAEKVKECLENNMAVTLTPDEAKQFHAEFDQSYIEYKQRAEAAEAKLRELEIRPTNLFTEDVYVMQPDSLQI